MRSAGDDRFKSRLQKALGADYTVIQQIGRGRMGVVYLATRKGLGDAKCAVKVLDEELAKDPGIVERFRTEAKLEARLQHPHILKVFDTGERRGLHFLVMTYVEGEDLANYLSRNGSLSARDATGIALQIAKALECAHHERVVHRDLKPANIRIDRFGNVSVMDFGIARVFDGLGAGQTVVGNVLGTPLYMSPEQADGQPADTRSDLYSLGVILFEMITGHNPFNADNLFAVLQRQKSYVPDALEDLRVGVPARLSALVARLLAKDPEGRCQSAEEVRIELEELTNSAEAPAGQSRLMGSGIRAAAGAAVESSAGSGTGKAAAGSSVRPVQEVLAVPATSEAFQTRVLAAVNATLAGTVSRLNDGIRATPLWVLVSGILSLTVVIVLVVVNVGGSAPPAQAVQVDAAPFASVEIRSSDGDVVGTFETPFQVNLTPGTYVFRFAHGQQEKSKTLSVGPGASVSVREEFWTSDDTKRLLDGYR